VTAGHQWHLDGWDRQGGRAFATRRSRGADLSENRPDWGPTVYIAPPDFRPEQVGSTSIALSAARAAYFAESVPANANADNELSFPSATAVAEFVRRAFVGSGRNRGGGGEGGAPPTDRNPPRSPEGEIHEDDALWNYLHIAEDLRKQLKGAGSRTALPIPSLAQAFAHGVREEGIESGALQLVATMLAARADGTPDTSWPSACTTLHRAMVELQLWQDWLRRPDDDPRSIRNAEYLWSSVSSLMGLPANEPFDRQNALAIIAIAAFLCSWPSERISSSHVEYAHYLLKSRNAPSAYYTYAALGTPGELFDRFSPMYSWLLPDYVSGKDKVITNVGGLLMAFIASPARVARWQGAADIVLFAAALLASRIEDRVVSNWRGRAAANWLAGSVPTHVFSPDIEALIWEPEFVREEVGWSTAS
jgi:hypothetical protein